MTLPIVAVVCLLIGLLLHAFSGGEASAPPRPRYSSTMGALGYVMILWGVFFIMLALVEHSQALGLVR